MKAVKERTGTFKKKETRRVKEKYLITFICMRKTWHKQKAPGNIVFLFHVRYIDVQSTSFLLGPILCFQPSVVVYVYCLSIKNILLGNLQYENFPQKLLQQLYHFFFPRMCSMRARSLITTLDFVSCHFPTPHHTTLTYDIAITRLNDEALVWAFLRT